MTLRRLYGPYAGLGLQQDLVYGLFFCGSLQADPKYLGSQEEVLFKRTLNLTLTHIPPDSNAWRLMGLRN